MKPLILLLLLAPLMAMATGKTSPASAESSSYSTGGDYRVIALPGGGAAPSITCVRWRWYGWGAYGSQDADFECLKLLAELEKLRATPVPAPAVQILTAQPQVCAPPAKAKSVAAAKKAGACKS